MEVKGMRNYPMEVILFFLACLFFQFINRSLQILLHPLGRGHVVLLLEGGVENGLALEILCGLYPF